MSNQPTSRFRIALCTSAMDDLKRTALIAGIQKVAPLSALMQVPASVAALAKKGAALTASSAAVAADEKLLAQDEGTREGCRVAVDGELNALKALVAVNATVPSDITSMGLEPLGSVVRPVHGAPNAPSGLAVNNGRVHGASRVAVALPGYQGQFAAEVSTDPPGANTWTVLPGSGKQRKLSGYASGTRLWVRLAAVRYGLQSDWCTPVLVTIP
jgi:hypothetical protein